MSKNPNNATINENRIFQFLVDTKYRIFRHFLLACFLSVVLFNSESEIAQPKLVLVMFFLLFYSNMYVLVPNLLFKNKYIWYCLSVLAILGALVVFVRFYLIYFENSEMTVDGLNVPLFSTLILVLIAASTSIKLFQKWIQDRQLIYELEKSKISTELEQLKNQINPHFLFNMLNNANVLTKKDPEKASQVLMKLSDLLRYQLYDSAREKVLLTSDIRFLEDFLNLEKVRRDNFDFLISKEGDLNGVQVPPLLFISFVENSVKHNNDSIKPSYVNLYFEIRNNRLFFKCINSKPTLKAVQSSGGLGLTNIKRRLELIFPETHILTITNKPEYYDVTLTIEL